MATVFVRPGHLHAASRVLSASTEAGLMVGPPAPATANKGQLRLRSSGTPTSVTSLSLLLQTGGNPYGYAVADYGYGAGAAAVWRNSTDTTEQYRGYIDTPYLVRVEYPVPYDAGGYGYPSTPRTLPNGNLGFIVSGVISASSEVNFYSVTPAGVTTTILLATIPMDSVTRPELVVMPSGRLLAFYVVAVGSFTSGFTTLYSDDNGLTWATLSTFAYVSSTDKLDTLSLEYVDDMIAGVFSSPDGSESADIIVSRDGGCTFSRTGTRAHDGRMALCLTSAGTLLLTSGAGTGGLWVVWPIAPGGGTGQGLNLPGACHHEAPILCRDDGTVWVWNFDSEGVPGLQSELKVSLDGGLSFASATDGGAGSQSVLNSGFTATDQAYLGISVGMWGGKAVMLAHTQSDQGGGTEKQIHMLTWGGWESVTDIRRNIVSDGCPYEHTYIPTDLPDAMGWSKTDVGAGATVTNEPALRIVGTGTTNTAYTSATAFYANAAGASRRLRFRARINSGGSISTNGSFISATMSDGVNEQEIKLRFGASAMRVVDTAGTTLLNLTTDLTGWVDWLVAVKHDSPAGAGKATVQYRKQGDELWTALGAVDLAEAVGTREAITFGGTSALVVDWEIAFIAVADDDNGMASAIVANPTALAGRPLTAARDYYAVNGVHLGGRNGGGIPGDSYTLATTYSYGKESIWRELRPSKKVHSAADNTDWNLVCDAGSGELFKGDTIGIFGTNFRTATLQFSATDSWGAPAATVALDAAVASFTPGASVRGLGYVGPATSLNWRPGQYRSDGDGHRWFVSTGAATYEITDNDADRLYVAGADFSLSVGTLVIFGDRMGATTTFKQYRFMRLLVGAQQTSDDCYHVGTPIFDSGFVPAQLYDFGFVDRTEPRVTLTETDGGYRSSARIGPRRHTLAIQWAPIAYQSSSTDLESRIRDFYASLEGGVFMFWRDTSDQTTLGLYRFSGTYQASNVRGEGTTALTRVDQLVLEEEL